MNGLGAPVCNGRGDWDSGRQHLGLNPAVSETAATRSYFLAGGVGFGSEAGFTSAADFCSSSTGLESSWYKDGSFSRFAM